MSSQSKNFITLTKNDPRFTQYLLGDAGLATADTVALPVQTVNLQRGNESVTFQLLDSAQIEKPWHWFFNLIRWELLLMTLAPAIMVGAASFTNVRSGTQLNIEQWNVFALAILALIFLHISVYCANDFLDHMGGLDRVSDKGGSHVIQRGWITARNVRRVGVIALILAFSVSLPLFLQQHELAFLALAVIFVLGMGYRFSRWGTPSPLLGLVVLMAVFGPLLTLSMEWLLLHKLSVNGLAMGLFTGLLALTYVHAKQIFSMATDQEAGISSVAIQLGVDRAVKLLQILCVTVFATFILTLSMHWSFAKAFWGFASAPLLFELLFTVRRVHSPFSSSLQNVFRRILVFYATAVLIFVLGTLL